jgi:hypothetical protein
MIVCTIVGKEEFESLFDCRQGDQMSLKKVAQNVAQLLFGENKYITFAVEKSNRLLCTVILNNRQK